MIFKAIMGIGERTTAYLSSFFDTLKFAAACIILMFSPKSYSPASKMVLIKQIYFTTVQIVPLFSVMAVLFGSIIIGVVISLATLYGLQSNIGSILITFVVDEFSPFFTALLISLRSGTAVNTEIAVMNVNKELNSLKEYKIDIVSYLFIPRIVSGIISVTALSIIFSMIMLTSGYIFTLFHLNMDLHTYKSILVHAVEVKDIAILLFKGISFGFVVMFIPIHSGLKTANSYTAIPISVLNGMVKLFIALFFIEVISLLLQSI